MLNHVFLTNIIAYCQQNRYVRFAIYTDLFTLSKGMSNVYLKITIEKNWRPQNVNFLSLKKSSPAQFLGNSRSRRYY